jgi:DNA-binding response OmpR family regulator
MIVDDDAKLADVIRRYLIRDGHQVECVPDGEEALRRVARQPPDLVILDLTLPGVNGLEVCRQLGQNSPISVIMVTGVSEASEKAAGLEAGADDYVTKPFSPRELTVRVRSVLRRARAAGPRTTPS